MPLPAHEKDDNYWTYRQLDRSHPQEGSPHLAEWWTVRDERRALPIHIGMNGTNPWWYQPTLPSVLENLICGDRCLSIWSTCIVVYVLSCIHLLIIRISCRNRWQINSISITRNSDYYMHFGVVYLRLTLAHFKGKKIKVTRISTPYNINGDK